MSISKSYSTSIPISKFSLWEKLDSKRSLVSFNIELTSRCNNNCTHCYINLPANDKESQKKEMSLPEIRRLAEEAVSMGVYSCLLTGGEPLIRKDFIDIYILLKKKGFLITVFTNATLITKEHIRFFKKYPPRDFEVSVYGVTKETYEKVTRKPGSFNAFIKGLDLLLKNGIKVRNRTVLQGEDKGLLPL
jgi:MoaA/NifB/PqqE/SkfB family radical SAM enzyme